jgi:F-type H+-transporting ATPase subunit delta
MLNPRLASRYAKSILDLAVEQGKLEEVYADMQWISNVCKSNRDFVTLLKSPVIKPDTKQKVLDAVTKGNVGEITATYNRLMVQKGREMFLPEIAASFISLYKEKKNIQIVKLSSAYPMSDDTKNQIINQLKSTGGFSNVELEEKVDPSLIGGFVLQVGDKLIDASVSYDLKNIAKQFDNNDFIYKIR